MQNCFALPFWKGYLKRKNLLLLEANSLHFLEQTPFQKGFNFGVQKSKQANRMLQKLSPLVKMTENY